MRGLKRQTGGADGRNNAVGRRRNAPGMEMRRAGLSGRQPTAVSRRPPTAPAPLLSIIHLARALFPTAGAFSLCSLPRSLQWHNSSPARPLTAACAFAHSPPRLLLLAHHLPSRYTAFLLLLRTAAACSLLVYKESKRVNKQTRKREKHAKQPSHAFTRLRVDLSTREVNGQTSKRVNERSTRSNHLTRLLVYESTCLQGK